MALPTVYIPTYENEYEYENENENENEMNGPPPPYSEPPPIKTKLQIQFLLTVKNNKKILNNYKIIKKLQKIRRNKFYNIWVNIKLSKGENITFNEKQNWKDLCIRLKNCAHNEYISQLRNTRKLLKIRELGCARRLNFYPGARKLKF